MEEEIAKIINRYGGEGIPEDLREVYEDYFNNTAFSDSESEADQDETLATELQPPQENVLLMAIDDIPVLEEDIEYAGEVLNVPVEILEAPLEDAPVVGVEDDVADILPIWEAVEMDAAAEEGDASIRACMIKGCCAKRCTGNFTLDEILQLNYDSRNLDYCNEGTNLLDLVLLGEIRAMARSSDSVKRGNSVTKKERERLRMMYTLNGRPICEKLFLLAHSIKIKRFKRLMKHYKEHGMTPTMHGNLKRTPKNVTKKETVDSIVSFIRNYAEEAALFMPGRLASQYNIVKLLPSSDSKVGLYRKYKEICIANNENYVSNSTFCLIWKTFCPDIVIMKPKSDLCELCQKHYTSHQQLRGASEEDKASFFEKCQKHLRRVNIERSAYKAIIKETIKNFEQYGNKTVENNGKCIPNSYDGSIHCSFDFAQQIHIPFNSLQPGPIYFLTPFEVGLFGIMNDTIKVQHNFVIPESCSVAKGANSIVSYLHQYFENHGFGEKNLYLHADNCVAQNKNNIVTCYLTWRIIKNLHTNITLSFLPVGHTKFACDWAFGLLKKRFELKKRVAYLML